MHTFFPRKLSWLLSLVCLATVGISNGKAQRAGQADTEATFEVSATALGVFDVPPLFYLEESVDAQGKPVETWKPLEVGLGTDGAVVTIPFRTTLRLFTGELAPENDPSTPRMVPYLDLQVGQPSQRLRLLFHLDKSGQTQHFVLEEEPSSHPAGSVRVVNLTEQRIAFQVGGAPTPILPRGQQIVTPSLRPDGRFPFQYFAEQPSGGTFQSPLQLLRFVREDSRLTVIFVLMAEEGATSLLSGNGEKPRYFADAVRIYDRDPHFVASAAAAPAPALATITPAETGSSAVPQPNPINSTVRECVLDILALGNDWRGQAVELGIAGQSGALRTDLQPYTLVPIALPVDGEARIFVRQGNKMLGEVPLGLTITQALLAVSSPTQVNGPAMVSLFESSEHSHPPGNIRVFNATPYLLAFTSGSDPVYVNPQNSALVQGLRPGQDVSLQMALEVDGKWTLIERSTRRAPPGPERTGLFVFPSSAGTTNFSVLEKAL